MGYWILLIIVMSALGIGLMQLFQANYTASTAFFVLAILLILLAIVTPKGGKK